LSHDKDAIGSKKMVKARRFLADAMEHLRRAKASKDQNSIEFWTGECHRLAQKAVALSEREGVSP